MNILVPLFDLQSAFLTSFSKCLLGVKHHLKENGLLYKYLSGFRANFSTGSCLAQLTAFILTDMNKGMHTAMILIDLQQAFD